MLHNLVCSLRGPREPGAEHGADPDLLLLQGIRDRSTCGRAVKRWARTPRAAAARPVGADSSLNGRSVSKKKAKKPTRFEEAHSQNLGVECRIKLEQFGEIKCCDCRLRWVL